MAVPEPREARQAWARAGEKRALTAIAGALAMIAVLLIVQMWLLSAALEAFLAGHRETALPAAAVSAILFAGVFALYRFIRGVDRDTRMRPRSRA